MKHQERIYKSVSDALANKMQRPGISPGVVAVTMLILAAQSEAKHIKSSPREGADHLAEEIENIDPKVYEGEIDIFIFGAEYNELTPELMDYVTDIIMGALYKEFNGIVSPFHVARTLMLMAVRYFCIDQSISVEEAKVKLVEYLRVVPIESCREVPIEEALNERTAV